MTLQPQPKGVKRSEPFFNETGQLVQTVTVEVADEVSGIAVPIVKVERVEDAGAFENA